MTQKCFKVTLHAFPITAQKNQKEDKYNRKNIQY